MEDSPAMSPHLDSDTIRPLYDVQDGGPPRGYECRIGSWTNSTFHDQTGVHSCARVTRTLRGMWTHQRIAHGIVPQPNLQFPDSKSLKTLDTGG